MKSKIKQILNTIKPQDLEEGCSRQVEEIEKLINKKTMIEKLTNEIDLSDMSEHCPDNLEISKKINEIIDYLNEREKYEKKLEKQEDDFTIDLESILVGFSALNDVWSPKFINPTSKEINKLVLKHFFSPK